jgi:hypothetical protein
VVCWDTVEEEPEDQPDHRHFPDPRVRAARPPAAADGSCRVGRLFYTEDLKYGYVE